ncbi:hypothetical protein T11_9841 [Trichinella zimbabwensis]|uniref:Uncharacterized protein n=1 Tax=Trichinella zimbabwensis TaxID=268475 RepID=A0A0V1I3S6_9BILA|nr:hypothetical protein T11_9841 [Trichinella zimbabwensis]
MRINQALKADRILILRSNGLYFLNSNGSSKLNHYFSQAGNTELNRHLLFSNSSNNEADQSDTYMGVDKENELYPLWFVMGISASYATLRLKFHGTVGQSQHGLLRLFDRYTLN